MKLIKLPNGNWANPAHVTSIEVKPYTTSLSVEVWCVMHAGYHTGRIYSESCASRKEANEIATQLASLLNQ
jgi:hypothetical protein